MVKKKKSAGKRDVSSRKLKQAETRADRWKAKAQKAEKRLAKLEKRLAKDTTRAPEAAAPSGPDDSWTVARLRVEARSRGLEGYSRKTKQQLLDALS